MIRFNRKGNFNVPFCRKPHRFTKSYITKIVNQVNWVYDAIHRNDWVFECSEFAKPIMRATEDDFVYCDPPYIARHVDYFNNWGLKEEKLLFDVLKNCKARFVLSAWHSNEFRENSAIDTYWKQFSIDTKEHFYHVGPKETNRRPIIEALIYNFEPLEIEDKTPVELTLFD